MTFLLAYLNGAFDVNCTHNTTRFFSTLSGC